MKSLTERLSYSAAFTLSMLTRPIPNPRRPKKKEVIDEAHHIKKEQYKAQVHYQHPDERQRLLNKMTNWQRNQYGKECARRKARQLPIKEMEKFAEMKRRA